jgi:hypothetical protein
MFSDCAEMSATVITGRRVALRCLQRGGELVVVLGMRQMSQKEEDEWVVERAIEGVEGVAIGPSSWHTR